MYNCDLLFDIFPIFRLFTWSRLAGRSGNDFKRMLDWVLGFI